MYTVVDRIAVVAVHALSRLDFDSTQISEDLRASLALALERADVNLMNP